MSAEYLVRITREALSPLEGIADYIHRDSLQNAPLVAQTIVRAIDSLNLMPDRFRVVTRSRKRKSAVHAMVVSPFIVYYRVDVARQIVHVLKVLHGAQRQPRRFK